jgi:hypothetical protein
MQDILDEKIGRMKNLLKDFLKKGEDFDVEGVL